MFDFLIGAIKDCHKLGGLKHHQFMEARNHKFSLTSLSQGARKDGIASRDSRSESLPLLFFSFLSFFLYIYMYMILFVYFLLCWVFVATHGLSLIAASGDSSLVLVCRLLIAVVSLVAEHGL